MRRPGMRAVLVAAAACGALVASEVAPAAATVAPAAATVASPAAAMRAVTQAAADLTLSPKAGPLPASAVTISGTGFGAHEAVDVYFDSTDEALAIAGTDGSFSGIEVKIPASAPPGAHFISADPPAHRPGRAGHLHGPGQLAAVPQLAPAQGHQPG